MNNDRKKRRRVVITAIVLNTALMLCVVCFVLSALRSAEDMTFAQNIENVRTLTNASANQFALEIEHHVQEIQNAAGYVNQYNGVGMTQEELFAYFNACYGAQDAYRFELADNAVTGERTSSEGFPTVSLVGDRTTYVYRSVAYPALAKIFRAASADTLGTIRYTSEFTDASPALAKSFAVTTPIRVRTTEAGQPEYQYKTLLLLLESRYINALIASNNDIDTLRFYDYSNIIIDDSGSYVISNVSFQGTNFLDFIALYNSGFSTEDRNAIRDGLKQEDYTEVFYYRNHKEQNCAYTIVPVQDSEWHILSIVPLASFHTEYNMSGRFLTFALLFGAWFGLDILVVLGINHQLRRATKRAREANESKSLFLSSMSHDIRTPMNAIIGMTEIAQRHIEAEPPDRRAIADCIQSIQRSGNHLLTLINDILDITKIESGKLVLHPSDFSIAEVVGQTIEMCRAEIREKQFVFEAHICHATREYVTGDALRVSQIFINILTNAVKYTEPGGHISVTLSQEEVPDNPQRVRFRYVVSDTGIGMTQEFVASIFDRFIRAVDTRINAVQGSGLGMSIVKQLVDLMGGTIAVQSGIVNKCAVESRPKIKYFFDCSVVAPFLRSGA